MLRLPGRDRIEVFVNADHVAWVTIQRGGEAVRVLYAGGESVDAHEYADADSVRDFIRQFQADRRFTPIRDGAELVNFSHARRVVLDHEHRTATVYLAGLARLEIDEKDFDAVAGRLGE